MAQEYVDEHLHMKSYGVYQQAWLRLKEDPGNFYCGMNGDSSCSTPFGFLLLIHEGRLYGHTYLANSALYVTSGLHLPPLIYRFLP
jgi:hypothetical protein